ncbi:hypothetical protein GCM10017673_44270 [Streptosporangium violaceochromogenes]|nr:hypothetical protein GCM10017673_44270 [Streptosporangium violaceochromogenes]
MSSVLLYLAIVLMWLCVLVPMWLRRDRGTAVEFYEGAEPYAADERTVEHGPGEEMPVPVPGSSPSRASSSGGASPAASSPSVLPSPAPPPPRVSARLPSGAGAEADTDGAAEIRPRRASAGRRPGAGRRRALRMAKRRRLTLWCVLLLLTSAVTAALQAIPWWGVTPSVVLLGLYLAILRTSVRVDTERRRVVAQARAERLRRARRRAEERTRRPAAQVIDLSVHRDELFDQYAAPPRRAVGD